MTFTYSCFGATVTLNFFSSFFTKTALLIYLKELGSSADVQTSDNDFWRSNHKDHLVWILEQILKRTGPGIYYRPDCIAKSLLHVQPQAVEGYGRSAQHTSKRDFFPITFNGIFILTSR